MTPKIRFSWKAFRFVETVQQVSNAKDPIAWNSDSRNISLGYICNFEAVEIPVTRDRAIALLTKWVKLWQP